MSQTTSKLALMLARADATEIALGRIPAGYELKIVLKKALGEFHIDLAVDPDNRTDSSEGAV